MDKITVEQIQEIAKQRNVDYHPLFNQLIIENIIEPTGEINNEDRLLEILPELNTGLQRNKVIERNEQEKNILHIRKDKYKQIKKLWELLNEKYIINYSEFANDEIEQALLNILEDGVNSSDVIQTEIQVLNIKGNITTIEQKAGLSLSTNKKLNYNEFLLKQIGRAHV